MSSSIEVLNGIQSLCMDGTALGETDGVLLERFRRERDEAAFAVLVDRHGPMVLRVCRSILGEADARDAVQTTFLVLVRRLRAIDRQRSLGPWLFGVARRTALRARADSLARRAREDRAAAEVRAKAEDRRSESWVELYEELAGLPARYRDPLVLCHLEGCSTERAAALLGCPRGTILSRLARGREELRERLTRRGFAPVAALLAAELVPSATAAVPPALAAAVVGGASHSLTGSATTSLVSAFAVKAALSLATIGGLVAGVFLLGRETPPPAAPARAAAPDDAPRAVARNVEQASVAFVARKVESLALRGHELIVFSAAFSPDGKLLATGEARGTIKLWDVATGREEASLTITPRQGRHAAIMALDFSPDGKILAMACDDQTIRLRDVATHEEKLVLSRPYFPNTLEFSPDSHTLAWGVSAPGASGLTPDETRYDVVLWDLAAGRERAHLTGHGGGIRRIAFLPDGRTIVSASDDHTVRLWDAATGEEKGRLTSPRSSVAGLAASPDGRSVATAAGDFDARDGSEEHPHKAGLVSTWDVAARAVRWSTAAHGEVAVSVAFSPNGRFLASSGRDDLIEIRDAATGEERAVLKGRETYIHALAFSPDGKTLVAAGHTPEATGGARLWRVGELLETLTPVAPQPLR